MRPGNAPYVIADVCDHAVPKESSRDETGKSENTSEVCTIACLRDASSRQMRSHHNGTESTLRMPS